MIVLKGYEIDIGLEQVSKLVDASQSRWPGQCKNKDGSSKLLSISLLFY